MSVILEALTSALPPEVPNPACTPPHPGDLLSLWNVLRIFNIAGGIIVGAALVVHALVPKPGLLPEVRHARVVIACGACLLVLSEVANNVARLGEQPLLSRLIPEVAGVLVLLGWVLLELRSRRVHRRKYPHLYRSGGQVGGRST